MKIGDKMFITYGVGELIIQKVKIVKITRKEVLVEKLCGGEQFYVKSCDLVYDRDLIQEVFDFIKNAMEEK